jgi:hypothetical protein
MEDPIWFPPLNVIYHGNLLNEALSTEEKETKRFRKVVEVYTVAQMLIAVMKIEGKAYWMQLVDDKHGSPDVRTIRFGDPSDDKFESLEQVDVEVVEYESHSNVSIPEFIVQKKFSKHKSYDENTIILCHVGGDATEAYLPDSDVIKSIIEPINTPCHIVFLAGTNSEATELVLYSLNPKIGLVLKYNPISELLSAGNSGGVMVFKRGVKKPPVYDPNTKHYPFEKLGYIPDEKGNY